MRKSRSGPPNLHRRSVHVLIHETLPDGLIANLGGLVIMIEGLTASLDDG